MRKNSKILTDLFWNVIVSMILVELANVGCGFVDGVIISRFRTIIPGASKQASLPAARNQNQSMSSSTSSSV